MPESREGPRVPGEGARELALKVLLDFERRDAYLNLLLSSYLGSSGLERRDRAFTTELVQGTMRMKGVLDWVLEKYSDRELDDLDTALLWILRLSAYQMLFISVPDHAACDQGVRMARRHLGGGGAAYANGVLRALAKGNSGMIYPDAKKDFARYLEVKYSHPRWVIDMWIDELGKERVESLCEADNVARPVCIRCNLLKIGRQELASSMKERGFDVSLSSLVPEGILLSGGGSLGATQEHEMGYFSVQDQGSILVGHAVSPQPGMRVLDMCAAPGGKSNHLAELMRNDGRILALDINAGRLSLLEESASRLGNTIIEARAMDAATAGNSIKERFDRVLVDAPCTGLGTLSRRPDVRWRKSAGDVGRLSRLQLALLTEGARMLQSGGLLVYSTCTISRRENELVVERFLESNPGFSPLDAGSLLPGKMNGRYLQLFPDIHGCDGVFIAVLRGQVRDSSCAKS
ncbi:MAG: 16S rRNA (cytosine(967)-C(5))-methyltransferase RsmB [Actinobacteria bacterium]|nr:16S rRNA (cytosine(967)-C(5))-methyltransferase RsmB [Actinomycetota bacterium]